MFKHKPILSRKVDYLQKSAVQSILNFKLYLKNGEHIPLEHDLFLEYPDGTKNLE